MSEIISKQELLGLIDAWIARGHAAVGPVAAKPDVVLYEKLESASQALWSGFIHPRNSIKEFFFPKSEPIYNYKLTGQDVELNDIDPSSTPQLIVGARPCDAALAPLLDHVFNWDYQDKFYNTRRAATTIVTLACTEFDANCFCTSVGISPTSERGSDAMLLDAGNGEYEVRCLTDKGKAFFEGKTRTSDKTGTASPGPEKKFDPSEAREFISKNFEHKVWKDIALRCVGCGACAYTCPTCHCFDLIDEGNAACGSCVKNWDCCQFAMFTHHASGHNPRAKLSSRQRQRIWHKFHIFQEKFGECLCTGCGNCGRNCPVSLGVLAAMELIREAADNGTP